MSVRSAWHCRFGGRAFAAPLVAICLMGLCSVPLIAPAAECRLRQPSRRAWRQTTSQKGRDVEPDREAHAGGAVKEWPVRNKRFALVIGVDSYQEFGALKGAVNDARLLSSTLKKYADFPEEQVELLTSDQTEDAQKPTKSNILRRLDKLRGKIPPDGMLLVSFAGHGVEGGDGQTYLLPQEAATGSLDLLQETAVSLSSLKRFILATGVKQVVLILDSCRTTPRQRATQGAIMPEAMPQKLNFDVKNKEVEAFVTLFATSPMQSAYEDAKSAHGYFTLELANAMQGEAADENGFVTLGKLIQHLRRRVPERVRDDLGQAQVPYMVTGGVNPDALVIAYTSPVLDLDMLASGRPLERPLASGDAQSFHLKPPAKNFLSLEVEPRGLSVNAAVFGPDNTKLYETDESEPLMLLPSGKDYYRLVVRAPASGLARGFYSIRAVMRPASLPDDDNRLAAQRAVFAARESLAAGKFSAALDKYNEALLNWRLAQDKAGEAKTLRYIGGIYESTGQSDKALDYYQQALVPLKEVGDRNGLAIVYTLISRIHLNLNDQKLALASLEEVIAVLQPHPATGTASQRLFLSLLDSTSSLSDMQSAVQMIREFTEFQSLDAKNYLTLHEANRLHNLKGWDESANADPRRLYYELHVRTHSLEQTATLRELGPDTAALFTLVTEQSCKVILVTPSARFAGSHDIPLVELNRKVTEFRHALQDPRTDPRPLAKELYDIIVKPVEADLKRVGTRTLLWSLDGTLRYLPIGALFDGKKYLAESYLNATITISSLPRMSSPPRELTQSKVLGLGVSRPVENFPALPGVEAELRTIVGDENRGGIFPGRLLLNESFTKSSMMDALLRRFPLVIIDAPGRILQGDAESSYLMLGDGSRLTLKELAGGPAAFSGVELLVLTASNTALTSQADGREVEGFAEVAQRLGARSVVASLWSPHDEATRELMSAFFRNLRIGARKGEALRQAQMEMLQHRAFSHPYYWASFVLFGDPR